MPLTIALDGPVGAGKSTVCDAVAKRLGILHLDTGAMYRAAALKVVREGISPEDAEAVCRLAEKGQIRVSVRYTDDRQMTLLDGEDVSALIRTQEIGQAASAISRYPCIRKRMVALQQEIARSESMLLDGRDIGTVVLKDADVKIYLTSSVEVRAQRRLKQLREKGDQTPYEKVLGEVKARDEQDMTRETDPLRQAEDAVLVDSSSLTFDETVEVILDTIRKRHAGKE